MRNLNTPTRKDGLASRSRWLCGLLYSLLLCCLPAVSAEAHDVQVRAWTHEATVGTNDVVSFAIEVRGAALGSVETPRLASTSNLAPEGSSPTARREASFHDGVLMESIVFRWTLRPVRAGTATIDPVDVLVHNDIHQTEAIELTVVPQSERPARSPSGAVSRPSSSGDYGNAAYERDLFIRAVPTTRSVYVHEQMGVEYQLLFREPVRPRASRLVETSSAEGLWKEELDVDMHPEPRSIVHNGESFQMIVLMRAAFFPTRVGTFTISPLRVRTEVQSAHSSAGPSYRGRDQNERVELASEEITVEARPPPNEAPSRFKHAVGQYALETRVNHLEVHTDEAIELTVELAGAGNLALLEAPDVNFPDTIDVLGPHTSTTLDRSGTILRGEKSFTYTLIPRTEGTLDLPPIAFSFFDPETDQFHTLEKELPGISVASASLSLSTGGSADDHNANLPASWLAALFLLVIVAGVALFLYRSKNEAPSHVADGMRTRPLEKARPHLLQARKAASDGKRDRFYRAVEQALVAGIEEHLQATPGAHSRRALQSHLREADLPEGVSDHLLELLATCDRAQYTPDPPSRDTMIAVFRMATSCLERLSPGIR